MAISANVLSGLAAALGGGMKAYNTQRDTDEEQRRAAVEEDRQQQLLARMISRDELEEYKTNADMDDAKFKRDLLLAQQGFKTPMNEEQRNALHPQVAAAATQKMPQASAPATLLDMDGSVLQRGEATPGPNYYQFQDTETERARIAQGNRDATMARTVLGQTGRDADRESRERIAEADRTQQMTIAQQRVAALLASIAQRGESGTPIAIEGPDGQPMLVSPRDAVGKRPWSAAAGQRKPPTGQQSTTFGFYQRMKDALDNMGKVEDQLSENELMLIHNSPLPDLINNRLLSPAGQQYAQALRTYTEARLRKESGANIKQEEFDNDRRAIARQYADSPDVLTNKRGTRKTTLDTFGFGSGPAYENYYGEPFPTPKNQKPGGGSVAPPSVGASDSTAKFKWVNGQLVKVK